MYAKSMKNGQNIIQHLNNNEQNPLISVVVMTYKNQNGLYMTLDTILNQNYQNIELIISDDASGQQDIKSIREYIDKNKNKNIISYRILCNEYNHGTVRHLNKMKQLCTGKYIKFLPCGDGFVSADSLEELFKFTSTHNYIIASSKSIVCNSDFSEIYYEFPGKRRTRLINSSDASKLNSILMRNNIISAVGVIFDRIFFEKYSFDEKYRYLEDLPLWLKITREGITIPCLDKNVVYYSVGGVSSEDGNAHSSKILRDDMIICYENEIIPYIEEYDFLSRYLIMNRYEKLKYYSCFSIKDKVLFQIKYLPIESYLWFKYIIKNLIINKGNNE